MYNKQGFNRHCNSHHSGTYRNFGETIKRGDWKANFMGGFNYPSANVRELDDNYELHLYAPGYEKSDFVIAMIDTNLSITVSKKDMEPDENWKRMEYIPGEFVRQFQLNEKIDKSAIKAKYENGVLIIKLPKLEGFETSREEIKVD